MRQAASALQEYRKQVATAEAEASGLYLSWLGKLPGVAVRLSTIFEHLHWCGDHDEKAASRIDLRDGDGGGDSVSRPVRRPYGSPLLWRGRASPG